MAKSGITLNLEGFDELIKRLEAAGQKADKVCEKIMRESAKVAESELVSSARRADLDESLISEIRSNVKSEGGVISAEVGWELGAYDKKSPSAGYKVIFQNYGTSKRKTLKGSNRGEISRSDRGRRQFIAKAKKNARPKIKKLQQEALDEILGGLKEK